MTAVELISTQPFRALPILHKWAKRTPSLANLLNLSAAQRACGQLDAAGETLSRCLQMDRNNHKVWNNIAQILTDKGEFETGLKAFHNALRCSEKDATVAVSDTQNILLGTANNLMRLGMFEHAWVPWEAGRIGPSWNLFPGTAMWDGSSDKRLLVICEGGFGDAFTFARWLPWAAERSKSLHLLLWPQVVEWCDWEALGVKETLIMGREIKGSQFDCTISWMSLPGLAGMKSLADVPPPAKTTEAFLKLHGSAIPPRQGVGFCWRAEENGTARKIRSLDDTTASSVAKELIRAGKTFSLCPPSKSLHRHDTFKTPRGVIYEAHHNDGWIATTRYIASLEAVVTVDTAVAHLAGLTETPTLLLLPKRVDWKWGLPSPTPTLRWEDHWYGPHVHYYREEDAAGWTAPKVVDMVHRFIEATRNTR